MNSVHPRSESVHRLDEIDKQIVHELMTDARNRSAPAIADEIGVSPGTVRSRIAALEERGIIDGYHAHVDFERTEGRLTTLFMCNVPFAERETVARAAEAIPGVINVRILMGGRRNFHVLAVGEDTADLRRVGTTLSELGVVIEDEMLVEDERVRPYAPYGPEDGERRRIPSDLLSIASDSEVVEVTVQPSAPIAGMTISEAVASGKLDDEPLIVSISRGDERVTPHGDTTFRSGDTVAIFAPGGVDDGTIRLFLEPTGGETT